MSMILYVRRATDEQIDMVRNNPASISGFFFESGAHESGDLIDFDKAWQAVHFTLSGAEYYTDDDLGALLLNSEAVGDDMGYGAAWIIPHDRMANFHSALSKMSDEDIRLRFDPQALVDNDIYAYDDCVEYPDEALEYLMQGIPNLRLFAEKCASTGSSALAAIC
jgi:Domain of unknown function (DUF1877)